MTTIGGRLFDSPSSPFVRKVNIVLHELGVAVERFENKAHPVTRDASIVAHNPLGQVPTLITTEGIALADSRVICEYLNETYGGRLFPAPGLQRWSALYRQSIADGALDAAILQRYENALRAPELRSDAWLRGQTAKIDAVLDAMESAAPSADRFDIGDVAFICLLGYLDFRFPEREWRATRPRLAGWGEAAFQRPSVVATRPRPKAADFEAPR